MDPVIKIKLHMQHINFKNKRVLVRVDFNVPLDKNQEITDDTRIRRAIPTLDYILKNGGKLIICTHLGRPGGEVNPELSTKHLIQRLSDLLGSKVVHSSSTIGNEALEAVKNNDIVLLENTRFYKEEKKGDETFAKGMAELADIYINDAFGTAHRAHASTTTVAKYFSKENKGFGLLMNAEIENGNKILNDPEKPVTAIIGGAKVSDKIKLIENLIDLSDHIIIGGGMAYTFIKSQGGQIGNSLCEQDYLDLARKTLIKANENNCQIHLPIDSVIANEFSKDAKFTIKASEDIEESWMGLDIGPMAIEAFGEVLANSKTILWNGPMGVFEFENFSKGTFAIAKSVAEATSNGAYSLIGGGDSVSAINKSGLNEHVSYVSTGGGAMLEFLEGKTLPGIAAMQE